MEAYELTEAARILMDFIDDLSNWYVRRSRKKIDCSSHFELCYLETSKLMAPFAPFIAEMIYKSVGHQKSGVNSIHLEDWPKSNLKLNTQNLKLLEDMAETRR